MKNAFVYDRVNKFGGAERVLMALNEIWPEAPLYTAIYDKKNASWAKRFTVIPSFLQHLFFLRSNHEFLPFLTSAAFEAFDFHGYDVVISITSAEAKSVITSPRTLHICYCLTPTRYLWSGKDQYFKNPGFGWLDPIGRLAFSFWAPGMRMSDQIASQRVDAYIAISEEVKKRINKYYRRNSVVINPPIDLHINPATKINSGNYYLVVSRLVPYKRVDLIVKAFNKSGRLLKVVGSGNQLKCLTKEAKKNIEFLGNVPQDKLNELYRHCRALIVAGEEDFGLSCLEAQAWGKPVVAYKAGGYAETVIDGKTGVFFLSQTEEDLELAIRRVETLKWITSDCLDKAGKYSKEIFKKKFRNQVEDLWQKYQKNLTRM